MKNMEVKYTEVKNTEMKNTVTWALNFFLMQFFFNSKW